MEPYTHGKVPLQLCVLSLGHCLFCNISGVCKRLLLSKDYWTFSQLNAIVTNGATVACAHFLISNFTSIHTLRPPHIPTHSLILIWNSANFSLRSRSEIALRKCADSEESNCKRTAIRICNVHVEKLLDFGIPPLYGIILNWK